MRWAVVAVVVLALANVALAADEQQKAEAKPKWIQGESKSWPKWGDFRLRWLKAERRESVRDRNDAQRELTVVKSWGRTYVRNRVSELVTKTSNRVTECKHFKSLWQIRNANYKFHKDSHSSRRRRRRHSKRKPWQRKSKKPKNKKKNTSKGYYFRKFSLHARMLIASRDRLAAARRASARCWGVVKKLRARRPNVEKSARATARNAVVRAKAHLQRTQAQVKAVDAKIARQLRRIRARLAKYKTYYFHRCSRVKGHKYRCLYSIRHGGGDHSRRPFKFFKCLWSSSNEVVVRHVCYK